MELLTSRLRLALIEPPTVWRRSRNATSPLPPRDGAALFQRHEVALPSAEVKLSAAGAGGGDDGVVVEHDTADCPDVTPPPATAAPSWWYTARGAAADSVRSGRRPGW